MEFWWIPVAVLAVLVVAYLIWRPLRSFGKEVQLARARELFKLQRERLEAHFFKAASSTGKPRGLRWKECQWEDGVEFVRERKTGQIAALVGVTISFEAIEGGDMEGVAAVGNLRNASGVFFFQNGQWLTVGKAVFNLNPNEVVERFGEQYERVV